MEEELLGGDLLYRVDDGVAWLQLNRPDMANALTPDQRNTMIDLFRDIDGDGAVRAVVLGATGGRHFCGGADLRANRSTEEPVAGTVMKMIGYGVQRLVTAILDCQKPVIASVAGTAAGIGVQLAIASDLVVMAEEASFVEVFVQRGIVPDGGAAYLLTRLCGVQRAKELMLLGEPRHHGEGQGVRPRHRGRATPTARRPDGRAGGDAGPRADGGHRADETAGQPGARRRPGRCVVRRGDGPGGRHDDDRRPRGCGGVRRAAIDRVRGY